MKNVNLRYDKVLEEISGVLQSSNFEDLEEFSKSIVRAEKIVLFGAGRVGLAMRAFAMRLMHLGINSYYLGDINVPKIGGKDLLIIGSGSGNTPSVATISEIANRDRVKIILITTNPESRVGKLSDHSIVLSAQTKESDSKNRSSIQPMTTLFEQSLGIFLDSLVLSLMDELNESHETMVERHNKLE